MIREPCREADFCNAKVWYIDGVPYTLTSNQQVLDPHVCYQVPLSSFPETVYVGVWKSLRTGRTRYVGPTKKEENARKAPENYEARVWELQRVMCATPEWSEMEDKETTYKVRPSW